MIHPIFSHGRQIGLRVRVDTWQMFIAIFGPRSQVDSRELRRLSTGECSRTESAAERTVFAMLRNKRQTIQVPVLSSSMSRLRMYYYPMSSKIYPICLSRTSNSPKVLWRSTLSILEQHGPWDSLWIIEAILDQGKT